MELKASKTIEVSVRSIDPTTLEASEQTLGLLRQQAHEVIQKLLSPNCKNFKSTEASLYYTSRGDLINGSSRMRRAVEQLVSVLVLKPEERAKYEEEILKLDKPEAYPIEVKVSFFYSLT